MTLPQTPFGKAVRGRFVVAQQPPRLNSCSTDVADSANFIWLTEHRVNNRVEREEKGTKNAPTSELSGCLPALNGYPLFSYASVDPFSGCVYP